MAPHEVYTTFPDVTQMAPTANIYYPHHVSLLYASVYSLLCYMFNLADHFLNCPLKHYSSHVRWVIARRRFTEQDQMHCMGTFLQGISAKIAHKYSFVVLYCQATSSYVPIFLYVHARDVYIHARDVNLVMTCTCKFSNARGEIVYYWALKECQFSLGLIAWGARIKCMGMPKFPGVQILL